MKPDAGLSAAPSLRRHRDIDGTLNRPQQLPGHGGAHVTEDSARPACEHGCHPSPLGVVGDVPDRVDPPVKPMQASRASALRDGVPSQPGGQKLAMGDRSMLTGGDCRDLEIP
jgi:hypothetical protein